MRFVSAFVPGSRVIDDMYNNISNAPRVGKIKSVQIERHGNERQTFIIVEWNDGTDVYEEPSMDDELTVIQEPSTRERIAIGHKF